MSVSRKARRQQARDAEKATRAVGVSREALPSISARQWAALRKRVRLVLLATTLIGLVALRLTREPVQQFLSSHGVWARVLLALVMLGPALFTWLIGVGQLRDSARAGRPES